jgi:transposase
MRRQALPPFRLESRWIGGLPLVNNLLQRLCLDSLLARTLPAADVRSKLAPSDALGVLLRNLILNERRPMYTQGEWAARAEPALLGLNSEQLSAFNDDRVGRALDLLFQADRASLMTELVLRAIREFHIDLDQLHNDSTTITFSGQYAGADGHLVRGHPTLRVNFGHNKDHRPDLKQLLFVLSVSADGAVPIHYKALDGNTADSVTHIDTWETLCRIAGRTDFLYVADCKLCSRASLAHIAKHGGRFITVLPRNRREDRWFRQFVQVHDPPWEVAVRRPNPRRRSGPEDIWKVVEAELPSREGYRIVWVWNSLMAAHDAEARQARVEKAWAGIERLQTKLQGKRCRYRARIRVEEAAQQIVEESGAGRWVSYVVEERNEPVFRQERRGRPGAKTRYVRKERLRFSVSLKTRPEIIEQDERTDGMFPLITNCRDLSKAKILEAYKFQPRLEKRHEQLKSVEDVTPVYLKKITRVEALLFLYFVALLVQALLEREVRLAMAREKIDMLPLYPEERECRAPSTERILELFEPLQRHRLRDGDRLLQTFDPDLSDLQRQLLHLLHVPAAAFTAST